MAPTEIIEFLPVPITMDHINRQDIHPYTFSNALLGSAGLVLAISLRIAMGIGILIIFTAGITLLAPIGLLVSPLAPALFHTRELMPDVSSKTESAVGQRG